MKQKKAMNDYEKAIIVRLVRLLLIALLALPHTRENILANHCLEGGQQMTSLSKTEFEIIEGKFHDGLGTYAELSLANALIVATKISQPLFDVRRSNAKMVAALNDLPEGHPSRMIFQKEMANIEKGSQQGAIEILAKVKGRLQKVKHVASDFADAKAGDLLLEFEAHRSLPISVKTDKSGKVAIAEGQTPDIKGKVAERYFRVSNEEFSAIISDLRFNSEAELRSHYLNVSQLMAQVLIRKLALSDCQPNDFSQAKVGNLEAAKYLFRQLLRYKGGNDSSHVIIFDRNTGQVKWESLLDSIEIESLTSERISFRPSRPRKGRVIGSEFGIKVDGKAVVTFQIKHKRGAARETSRWEEFSDITIRLLL
jgi:hypothetical protein